MKSKLLGFKVWLYIFVLRFFYGFSKIKTKVIYAQVLHETGNFTSAIFKENKNLFGMRQAKIRKNTATGTNRHHAIYKGHFKSVVDYFLRQKHFGVNSENDILFMASTVNSGYAEDNDYLIKWQKLVDTTKEPLFWTLLLYGGLFFFAIVMTVLVIKQNKK